MPKVPHRCPLLMATVEQAGKQHDPHTGMLACPRMRAKRWKCLISPPPRSTVVGHHQRSSNEGRCANVGCAGRMSPWLTRLRTTNRETSAAPTVTRAITAARIPIVAAVTGHLPLWPSAFRRSDACGPSALSKHSRVSCLEECGHLVGHQNVLHGGMVFAEIEAAQRRQARQQRRSHRRRHLLAAWRARLVVR